MSAMSTVLDILIRGMMIGFFFPLGSVTWLLRQGLWGEKWQIFVGSGVVLSLIVGILETAGAPRPLCRRNETPSERAFRSVRETTDMSKAVPAAVCRFGFHASANHRHRHRPRGRSRQPVAEQTHLTLMPNGDMIRPCFETELAPDPSRASRVRDILPWRALDKGPAPRETTPCTYKSICTRSEPGKESVACMKMFQMVHHVHLACDSLDKPSTLAIGIHGPSK
ncbi:hypothetical protein DCS_08166 [Drechmeria coniospora]|uniref:DSC E3 ubiquitin ligase complex subunit 3 C-terminal domain-containing protein n=1 Tax=Drechmeria coniospora TaxID=98403 RepID=A0A151GGH0_DRECN|nr:hypothetical protein DCS_08166 [Drechmeria coniospora]KYK56198.1 hypothetical protein DCS_08166 [Drechmeria coniospora]